MVSRFISGECHAAVKWVGHVVRGLPLKNNLSSCFFLFFLSIYLSALRCAALSVIVLY
jgi:hypothetical protein